MIAFVGCVFSPYYAARRRRGPTDPMGHCALNVAVYGPTGKRWSLTERDQSGVSRSALRFAIGSSALAWDADQLCVSLDERAAPIPSRIRGRLRVEAASACAHGFVLDHEQRHHWRPILPCARVTVELDHPQTHWTGSAYFDSNHGDAPLERGFLSWNWSRATLADSCAILYDALPRSGRGVTLALRCEANGRVERFDPPPRRTLAQTGWRVGRATRSDPATEPRVVRTLEDTPFYSRSIITSRLLGEDVRAIHESLSLERFGARWVQALLPFRMRRARF